MAWLSVGTSNDDLCDKMVSNGVLEEGKVLNAFRSVDRGDFVPQEDRLQAYLDRPFKKGSVHISAPHMYVTVLEALDLKPGNAFLNVGSGSGYLCCLAWCLLGEHGLSHGIEISKRMVEFSRANIQCFHQKRNDMLQGKFECEPVTIVEGNCFDIDIHNSMMQCRYDRIYVGAGCPEARKQFFYDLLADGGVLVLPINEKNQMLKVTKITGNIFSVKHVSNVHFAPLIDVEDEDDLQPPAPALPLSPSSVESQLLNAQVESLFVFQRSTDYLIRTPSNPSNKIQLPTLVWAPVKTRHRQFPFEFRSMVKFLLLASNQCDYSRFPMRSVPKCLCSLLPTPIWYIILSYASRDWFIPQKSEVDMLRLELMTERRLRKQAEEKLYAAEQAKRVAERERDLFRSVMMRLGPHANKGSNHNHVPGVGQHHLDMDDEEEDDDEISEEEEEEEEDDTVADGNPTAALQSHTDDIHDVAMLQDHDEDDDEVDDDDSDNDEEEDGDELFQDAVDDEHPITGGAGVVVLSSATNLELSPILSRSSYNVPEISTSFGSNTTHESIEDHDHHSENDNDNMMMAVDRDDRSSFYSTSTREENNSISDGDIRLSFEDGVDVEEHFASDL